jgi:hypothetical protein
LLFAQALLFVDHYVAANVVNIAVYVGFILALLTYATRARALAFLMVYFLIVGAPLFTSSVATPLTDLPRTCFSVLAIVFADRYLREGRYYDAVISGLLVGAAIAGKYTELLTLGLIGLCLLWRLLREKRGWSHLIGFGSAVLAVAGFWYLKNWILLGNPIYPFLFAHPGLSDAWMADYLREMSRAFDPADRIYVTNLLTARGWHDFLFVVRQWFFANQLSAQIAGLLFVVGVALPFVRLRMLAICTIVLFVVWYAIMFNSIRWAMPADLLFLASAFIVSTRLYDRLAPPYKVINLIAAAATIAVVVPVARSVAHDGLNGLQSLTPGWMDRSLFNVEIGRESFDDYLSARREGYALYRYIAVHDLRAVFQPFDNGAVNYVAAYNGGRDGKWILHYRDLPKDKNDIASFIANSNIRYFIYRRDDLFPVEAERFGQSHVDMAQAVFDTLLPHAVRLKTDAFGWSLYEVSTPPAQN